MSHPSDSALQGRSANLRTVLPDGTPVYRYAERPGRPSVSVVLADTDTDPAIHFPVQHQHAHDFLVLVYVEHGAGSININGRQVTLSEGAVRGVTPGQVIKVETPIAVQGRFWSIAFTPDAVPALASVSPLTWTQHPLLAIFDAPADGVSVPAADRPLWVHWISDLRDELAAPDRLGADQAATALLTRLLVASARLSSAATQAPDPLVQRVFEQIEIVYTNPVSATEVAVSLGYTAGYLTTVIRERTGRTLLDWITERRLTEARRLLRETNLPLSQIATRTGLRNASYLVRRFKARYGITPDAWRRTSSGWVG